MKRTILTLSLLMVAALLAVAQQPGYRLKHSNRLENKIYYFTALMSQDSDVVQNLRANKALAAIAGDKRQRLLAANDFSSRIASMKFTEDEIDFIASQLAQAFSKSKAMQSIVSEEIIPSGCYRQSNATGAELVKLMWRQDALGMNHAIDLYAAGEKPIYASIDSIGFDVRSKDYQNGILPTVIQNIELATQGDNLCWAIPLTAVKVLLDVNDRCQVIDFEPLSSLGNQAQYVRIKQVDWSKYAYSAILVLGAGPLDPREHISPYGRLRASYAAQLYRQGLAPFIIVSGGRVHPYHTPYCEAEEMRKYLVATCGIPAEAVIIEPQARHTTTNIRNAARIMLREGFPFNKPALLTSSASHLDYVAAEKFLQRCLRDMKIIPFKLGKRISPRVFEFWPLPNCTQLNPEEPLDP